MIIFVCALQVEARPLIEYFHLKKDMSEHKWPVYKNDNYRLIVSGTGKIKAAMAAAHLLSRINSSQISCLINFGICGSNSGLYQPGAVMLTHKVEDIETGRSYYPDLFAGHDLPGAVMQCHSRPVYMPEETGGPAIFCDLESAGIMEAAVKYLSPHQVVMLKIISDKLDSGHLPENQVKTYLVAALPALNAIIAELEKKQSTKTYDGEIENLVREVSGQMRLTATMQQQLQNQAYRFCCPENSGRKKDISDIFCAAITSLKNTNLTRSERKIYFDQLMRRLEK